MRSKKFALSSGCDEIVALRSARRRILHDRISRGLFVLTTHRKQIHDRQATKDCCPFLRLIPTDVPRSVHYSALLPYEWTRLTAGSNCGWHGIGYWVHTTLPIQDPDPPSLGCDMEMAFVGAESGSIYVYTGGNDVLPHKTSLSLALYLSR